MPPSLELIIESSFIDIIEVVVNKDVIFLICFKTSEGKKNDKKSKYKNMFLI